MIEPGSFHASVQRLFKKGIRYSTVIDVGCADAHFFLELFSMGLFPEAVPLNVDVNRLYEGSLKAIKEVAGGDYRISALSDSVGEIEVTESVHPYWSSIRPEDDPYWSRLNGLVKGKIKVPVTTLDILVAELGMKPPFLLKLDVQGAEQNVLRGGRGVLESCHTVICEADIDDFAGIDSLLVEAGFILYDITRLSRLEDDTLGWFYPVYINRKIDHVRPRAIWDAKDNDLAIQQQVNRRSKILESNARILDRLRKQAPKVGRNEPCPCGSGKRFKHCCGAYESSAAFKA